MRTASLLLSLSLLLPASLHAQAHELVTGEVVIGPVVAVDARFVDVQSGADADAARRIARRDFQPQALYRILRSRVQIGDAAAHEKLAGEASALGLQLHAIAELREAQRLEPKRRAEFEKRIAGVRAGIADGIADQARLLLKNGRPAQARLHAEVLLDRYADTPAGRNGEKLVMMALDQLMESSGKPVGAAKLARVLKKVDAHEARADKVGIRLNGAVTYSNGEKLKRERAIRSLEKAWGELADVRPGKDVDAEQADRYVSLRDRVREKLGAHYLAIGNLLVQRLALNSAADYNARACDLDPKGGGCRILQGRIIEARISRGFGY